MRAAFTGLTLATTAADPAAAVVDGVVITVADLAAAAARDGGHPLARLRIDGGITRARRVAQALADWLQIAVEVYPGGDATAMGVASLGDLGLGDRGGADRAASGGRSVRIAEPALGSDQAASLFSRWRQTRAVAVELAPEPS